MPKDIQTLDEKIRKPAIEEAEREVTDAVAQLQRKYLHSGYLILKGHTTDGENRYTEVRVHLSHALDMVALAGREYYGPTAGQIAVDSFINRVNRLGSEIDELREGIEAREDV